MLRKISILFFIAFASQAVAGELTTLQGKTSVGTITLGGGAIQLKMRDGQMISIDPGDVLRATFARSQPIVRAVMLRSGEVIPIDSVQRLDESGLHVTSHNLPAAVIPIDRIARVIFRPIPPALQSHVPSEQAGVLLDSGDFFQGEVRSLSSDHVQADSVLFGAQSFDLNNQALAIVFHDTAVPQARWIVRGVSGAVLLAEHLKAAEGRITFDDAQLGALALPLDQIAQIEAGGSLFRPLTSLPMIDATADTHRVDRTFAGVPMTFVGSLVQHGIAQRPGTTLSWRVDGSVQSFVATVGVPATLLPVGTVRFIVLADDREIARSGPLSSVDDPTSLAADVSGAKVLSLRIESPTLLGGLEGLWANPICVNR